MSGRTGKSGKVRSKGKSRSSRAVLQFPVGRILRKLRKGNYAQRIGGGTAVYLAAALEYLAAEVLDRVSVTALVAFASDPSGELDVLGHDRHSLGVDRAQIGVLEQADQIGFGSLLQGEHCRRLEAEIRLEVLRDFTDQALKHS
ncbi:hypothetical protein WR25_24662 [Diploscapter pachys]|uniref:Histone H2A n=1 Tax=Diploscapter pachys TaxID=2018661 RepID=A0A2A2KFK6_9BILA|nr:hypothetical protein WR25_24662 [Diploscapter pachys]